MKKCISRTFCWTERFWRSETMWSRVMEVGWLAQKWLFCKIWVSGWEKQPPMGDLVEKDENWTRETDPNESRGVNLARDKIKKIVLQTVKTKNPVKSLVEPKILSQRNFSGSQFFAQNWSRLRVTTIFASLPGPNVEEWVREDSLLRIRNISKSKLD